MGRNSDAAERDFEVEAELCHAIRERRVVRLRYDLDLRDRVFEPYVIFQEPSSRVMVGGRRVLDENDLFKPPAMRQFEVGLINSLEITEENFEPDERFDSTNLKRTTQVIEVIGT